MNGPTVGGSAVVFAGGLLAGFQASYNTQLDEKDQARTRFRIFLSGLGWVG